MSFDKITEKLVALGVPALVLIGTMYYVGWAGAAAITASLALLGGPFGMLGGIAVLGLMTLTSQAITQYGFEAVYSNVVCGLRKKGKSKIEIKKEIDSYLFISDELKIKLKNLIDENKCKK